MKKVININEGEYWWGGVVDDAYLMPLSKESKYRLNLNNNETYNQGVSLFLSSQGRYVWCDDGGIFTFERGNITVEADCEIIVYEGGKTLKEAYLAACNTHFPFNGKYPNDTMFLVPQYCTWIELLNEQTEENILNFAKSILDSGMPAGEIIIDNGWQTDYGNWTFHAAKFQNPKSMIAKLHEMGFKVILWIVPYVSPDSHIFLEQAAKGGFIRRPDKKPLMLEWWEGFSAVLDMSNPVDIAWLSNVMETLMKEYGVDGFKQDGGDARFFTEPYQTKNGKNANNQSELYASFAEQFEFNELRACYKCGGKGIAQRITDRHHKWDIQEGLQSLIPNSCLQGLLGYAYTCPDMVGGGLSSNFKDKSPRELDKELFIRSCQCSALMPMMQLSYAFWRVFDEVTVKNCIKHTLLHAQFHDEIIRLVKNASLSGEPIIRSIAYEFNQGFDIKDQFMLGENYLVAPVVEKGQRRKTVFFPKGEWQCPKTGKCYPEGYFDVDAPLDTLLYFQRKA